MKCVDDHTRACIALHLPVDSDGTDIIAARRAVDDASHRVDTKPATIAVHRVDESPAPKAKISRARLRPEQIREILKADAQGMTTRQMCEFFGRSPSSIRHLIARHAA
jgi:hypothetical protein